MLWTAGDVVAISIRKTLRENTTVNILFKTVATLLRLYCILRSFEQPSGFDNSPFGQPFGIKDSPFGQPFGFEYCPIGQPFGF